MLDMPRVREVFEASTDFTVGIEEEFGILDPATLSLDQRFEELRDAAQEDPVLARVGGRRADPLGDRDPLRARRDLRRRRRAPARRARAAVRAAPRARTRCWRATGTHPWSPWQEQRDHRHRALPPGRERAPVRGVAQQHLQRARARRGARRRPRDRGVRPAAAGDAASCSRSRPTRRFSTAATRGSTPRARRSSRRASRAAASRTRSAASQAYADYVDFLVHTELDRRVHPGVVERPAAPLLRHGGDAHLRRADERRRLHRPRRADHGLRRPGGARLRRGRPLRRSARPADRGELLAGDPPRARRQADRPRAERGVPGRRGRSSGCSPGPRRRAAGSASSLACPAENGAQRQKRALAEGASMQEVYAAEVELTQRTYAAEEVKT